MSTGQNNSHTVIGTDAVFKGQLKFEKGVKLLGQFEGEIESPGELTVAEGAKLCGEVKAGQIAVNGLVKGNLHANAKVCLTGSSHIEGDICASRLEVADGAVLIGRCSIGTNGKNGSAAPKPPMAKPVVKPVTKVPPTA